MHQNRNTKFLIDASEAANILNLLSSQLQWSFENSSDNQFVQQYTPFHCEWKSSSQQFPSLGTKWHASKFEETIKKESQNSSIWARDP